MSQTGALSIVNGSFVDNTARGNNYCNILSLFDILTALSVNGGGLYALPSSSSGQQQLTLQGVDFQNNTAGTSAHSIKSLRFVMLVCMETGSGGGLFLSGLTALSSTGIVFTGNQAVKGTDTDAVIQES